MKYETFLCRWRSSLTSPSLSPPLQPTQTIARPTKAAGSVVKSVTKEEIEKYWMLKKMVEEEHLLAALKAAAKIKARALSEEDYKRFEESLRDVIKRANEGMDGDDINKELRVGIKDWWTRSRYAYLNQPPAATSMGDDAASKGAAGGYASTPPPKNRSDSHSSLVTSLGVF